VTAVRVCSGCGELDPVREGGLAWPHDWSCRACGRATSLQDGIPLTAPSLADTIIGFHPDRFAVLARIVLRDLRSAVRGPASAARLRSLSDVNRSFIDAICRGLGVTKVSHSPSTYSPLRRLSLLVNALTSFSNRPLIYIFQLGLMVMLVSIASGILLMYKRLTGAVGVPAGRRSSCRSGFSAAR